MPVASAASDSDGATMTDMPPLRNASADPVVQRPPSALTRDDWVRIYDEAFVGWMDMTPQERWREATRRLATYVAHGGRLDDDLTADGLVDEDVPWNPRPNLEPLDTTHLRRRGV